MKKVRSYFDFRKNALSIKEIHDDMHENLEMGIDNVIILASAIFIACIGLNTNSIPVIIGAMLISPIMSPLFTIAYSLVIKDGKLLRKAGTRLIIYIIIALIVSTIYFKLSFIKNPTSELIARTNPTIFDILIAIFGGLAGIIGVTRKEKTNVIPGVAIATALMPPLCTIGYGLANFKLSYILNASILFVTNAYFIVLTSMLVLFFMRFHKVGNIEEENQNKIRKITLIILGLILFVTALNTYNLISKANVEGALDTYVYENINIEENIVTSTTIDYNKKTVTFIINGDFTQKQKEDLKNFISAQKYIGEFEIRVLHEQVDIL